MTESSDIHRLVPSSNTGGRYALGDPTGPEISAGKALAIHIGGDVWVEGRVEYGHKLYINMGLQYLGEPPREPAVLDGYYVETVGGRILGLCAGMEVRLI